MSLSNRLLSLPLGLAGRLNPVCDRFEEQLLAGMRPHLEEFLPLVDGADRPALLRELLVLELEHRARRGETPGTEEYLARLPEHAALIDEAFAAASKAGAPRETPAVPSDPAVARRPDAAGQPSTLTVNGGDPARPPMGVNQTTDPPRPARLRCPHCDNPVQLADGRGPDVLCPGCGQPFRVPEARETTSTLPMRPLGKFQLLERVGAGAFGAVWKARDTTLDRIVALKIPHTGLLTAEQDLERFLREARAAAQLRHPGIVSVHEVATVDGLPVIAAEFVAGVTLKDLMEARRLTWREAAVLVADLAEAVHYAHTMGVVHRDLKPTNIMVGYGTTGLDNPTDPKGAGPIGRPRVMDFGLARRAESDATLTAEGHVLGTPAYMSPEQAAGRGHEADGRSDVYSLGVVLYELLTGQLPFRGSKMMMLAQVLNDEPRPPRRLERRLPVDLDTICLKALAKKPERRYATARALADDLHRFLEGRTIRARPAGVVERTVKWARRRPAAAALAATLVLAAAVVVGLEVWFTGRLSTEGARVEQAHREVDALVRSEQEAKAQAEKAQTLAEQAKAQADGQTRRAQELLADAGTASGLVAFEHGDPAQAALWFASAVDLAPHDEHRTQVNRLRFQLWSNNLAQPSRAVVQPVKDTDLAWDGSWNNSVGRLLPHPDGVHLLAWSAGSNRWTLWDMAAEKAVPLPHADEEATAASWSAAGDRLAVGTQKGRCLVLSWPEQKVQQELPPGGPVQELSFSKDGRWLALAQGNEVRVWDAGRGAFLGEAVALSSRALWVVFDGRGTRLAVAGADRTVRVYRVVHDGGQEGLTLLAGPLTNWTTQYHFHSCLAPVWVDDDRGLLTCASMDEVGWWDPDTGNEVRRLRPGLWNVDAIVLSPDGQYVAVSGWWGCQLFQAHSGTAVGGRLTHTNRMPCAAFSPDGRWLLTGSTDQSVKLWSVPDGQLRATTMRLSNEAYATAFLGDGLVAGQLDGLIRLWRPGQPAVPFHDYRIPEARLGDLTTLIDDEGRRLLALAPDDGVRVIDLDSGLPVGKPLEKAGPFLQGAFVPHRSQVVIQNRQTIGAWDWETGQPVWGPVALPSTGLSVAASPDGRFVISMCAEGGLLLDAATGKTLHEFVHEGKSDLVNSFPMARFSPDGSCFVTFHAWLSVTVWDVATARPRFPPLALPQHTGAIAFSQDSRYLATGSEDNTARVFDLSTGRQLAKLDHPHWVFDVAFSADGRQLMTTGRDGSARLWDWRAGKLACPPMDHGNNEAFRVNEVFRGCFLPHTPWLLTATSGFVQAWDSALGKPVSPPLALPSTVGSNADGGLRVVLGDRQAAAFGEHGLVRVYDFSSLSDAGSRPISAEEMRRLAEIQSMYTVHEQGGLARLTTAEWLERWRAAPDRAPWSERITLEDWLGADQLDALHSLYSRATQSLALGDLLSAEAILRRVLEGYRRQLGPDHADTLACMNQLGVVYWRQRKFDRSVPLFEELLALETKKRGADDPATLLALANLGVNYRDAGRPDDGARCLEQALEGVVKNPTPGGTDPTFIRRALADAYQQGKRFDKAEALYRELLEQTRRQSGDDAPPATEAQAQLAANLLSQDKFAEAEKLLRDCLAVRQQKEPESWTTFNTQSMLGEALAGQKHYSDAEPLLRAGYDGVKERQMRILPSLRSARLGDALKRLVRLYEAWGKKEEADRWRQELSALEEKAPPSPPKN